MELRLGWEGRASMKVPGPGNGRLGGYNAGAEPTVSTLFTLLWEGLADLLGTAATATLLKRASRRAAARSPDLSGLVIVREGLAYAYSCPPAWSVASDGTPAALRALIDELRPLLLEMTGQIAIRHLEQILELRNAGLFAQEEPK
jgi:hypothetical protein